MTWKQPALITVLSGRFDNQMVAFAALRKIAGDAGLSVDLGDVDVIREATNVRLAHYFRPGLVGRIQNALGTDDTLFLLRASSLTANPNVLVGNSNLRLLGRFAGQVVEPLQV